MAALETLIKDAGQENVEETIAVVEPSGRVIAPVSGPLSKTQQDAVHIEDRHGQKPGFGRGRFGYRHRRT